MLYLSFMSLRGHKIDRAPGRLHQNPAGGDVPQTDSLFDVSVEAAARNVSHVERGAAEHAAFTHAMNHLLEQRKICFDRFAGFGKSDGDDGFGEIGAFAHAKMMAVQARVSRPFARSTFRRALDRKSPRR